jgi:von Hippel-Lindau disease tumor suppressor protein
MREKGIRPYAFALSLAIIAVLAQASVAWPCSCLSPAGPPCALGVDAVVFVGSVTWQSEDREANGGEGVSRSLFSVSEAFAGVGGGQIEVQSDLTSCGVQFAEGRSYLVVGGRREDGSVRVHACSNTGPAEGMKDEIAILRALRDGQSAKRVYGRVIEFREPQPHNRSGDPELYQPLAHVRVTIAGAQEFRETTTNPEGRFEFEGLAKGQYRVAIYVKPPKRVLPHGTGFHQADSDPAAVMVEECPARVHFTVSEWTELTSNLAPLLEAHECEGAFAWPSLPSQVAATIRFDNGRVAPVRVYWIDFAGNRVFYQTIPPGQAVYQPTFESHRWIVTTEADECLALYEPSGSRSIAEIR